MSKSMNKTKKFLTSLALSAMLFNTALPPSLTLAHAAANPSQQELSNGTFNADEVNRILASLTPEQKANINKLTGSDIAEKIRVEQKDLRSHGNINVIVQFKTDPAKIQIIKQSLSNSGATVNSQSFANDYSTAQKKVADAHATFKSYVNTQPKTQIIGGKSVNTTISITREYTEAFNGVSLSLPARLVEKIANNPEVASIWSQVEYTVADEGSTTEDAVTTGSIGKPTTGLTLLGLDKLQAEGHTGIIKSGPRAGQKIKVGVLDTGIDYNHPDLKAVYKGGHDLVNNAGIDANGHVVYVDDHDPMETTYDDWEAAKANPDAIVGPPPADYKLYITSHGTHVSGTIAANTTDNNSTYSANGIAPDVDLYGYRVLGPGGRGTSESVLSGIDQAVKDDMDVINLSLGANLNDPMYPTSIAVNNATLAGVVCDVAAGNAGPGAATVGSPGTSALAITVGASSIPGDIPVMTLMNGSSSYQARLFGKNFSQADDAFKGQTYPIVDVGLGSEADYNGLDMSGKIALVKRGGEFLQTKMANAKNAGVAGMIIWNNNAEEDNQGYITSFLGVSMDNVYSVSLTQEQGQTLSDTIFKDPKSATITFPETLDAPISKKGDELANFSSTGPVKDWSIKPDVVAPGVDISSTVPYDVWEPQAGVSVEDREYTYAYELMSGTSMATPHVAGISALILAAHPEYTPADVKSALMNTAKDINTDSKTYSVYQVGAGRVDPARAIKENVKIQVLDKAYTVEADSSELRQVDHLTGSMFFGFKGRGEGATNGSDDVISSKDFTVTNQGTSSKTFNVSTQFISTKFAGSNIVGPGTGNDVKIDFSTGGTDVTSINVDGGSNVQASAKITVPSNALEGIYEGYINLVNVADSSESYRIPFTITVAEKGIDTFKIAIKAMNPTGISAYNFSINSTMENFYMVLKDKNGNYLGVTNTLVSASEITPGVQYGPRLMLFRGQYLPFTKPFEGSYDQTGISTKIEVIKEGSYSVEMIMTDAAGKRYTAEDTLYVDSTPPTITMDSDSKPGIYEIDPTGYQPGQEIKGFYGTVYDSNVDVMKENGETSVSSPKDGITPVPVDQALNGVIGYQDSLFPTVFFDTDEKGRFHFGITPEDLTSKFGSYFWIYPHDYSGTGDAAITAQDYYFIKKGTPYLTVTSFGGVDAGEGNEDKVVVDANKPFKAKIATKYGIGMTGGTITLNTNEVYEFSNIRLSEEYKNYLISKGIDPATVLTVGQPYVHPVYQTGENIDVTISGIGANGALDQDMNIIEADVTYSNSDPIVGPFEFKLLKSNLTLSGEDTKVAWFPTNVPNVRQSTSLLRGRVAAEAFARNNVNNNYPQFTVESGAKVTVKDEKGKTFTTDNPTSFNNTIAYTFINPYYAVTMDVSNSPYAVEASVPGHFKGYAETPVIGENKFGYQSGTVKDIPGLFPILLGGDVNEDNVIDMKDLIDEINVYYQYKNLSNFNNPDNKVANKTAFLNTNRNADIYWIKPTTFGYGIDYNDFYFIFKNFGKQNQSAIDAGLTVPTAQMTVDQDMTITTQYGGSITLNSGDTVEQVMQKLNFAGPKQKTLGTTIPKLQDMQNGATISLIPQSDIFVDDVVWRKAITKVMIGSNDVTSAVNIKEAYMYPDQNGQAQTMPSQIILPGSLFTASANYTVTIKAAGYLDVTTSFTVSAVPIPTPAIPIITDPSVAHIGQDLALTFTEDANWRNGINKIVVTTNNSKSTDITNLINPDTNQRYYDITQPGKITFNAKTFMTNSTLDPNNTSTYGQAMITPGGTSYLPQLYKFTISSTGTDGTVYPDVIAGSDPVYTGQQAVGYGITFNSQGGSEIDPIAVGFRASSSRSNGPNSDLISYMAPKPTRAGYKFLGWFNEPEGTTTWDAGVLTADKTVYAKWQMNFTQSYSPVDVTKPNGLKFDGTNGTVSGVGWVLGEGDLKINIPDFAANIPWLTSKDKIAKIDATYYKLKADGTTEATPTTYTLDPSTYEMSTVDRIGTLSFTTATESYATANPNEQFAISAAPSLAKGSPYSGYKLKVTATTGETIEIPDVKVGYRRHIDLNGGTLKNSTDLYFADTLVNGKATAPNMQTALSRVTNGNLSISENLYLDSANSSDKVSTISQNNGIFLTDNATYYLCWIKTPPTVLKDIVGNIVGSDITLNFTDDGTWKNNIKQVKIGAKELELDKDYTITNSMITLNHDLFTAGQKVNVIIVSEGYADALVMDQVIGYKVTFESNGGDPVPAQIVDRSATKPLDPTKIGYKFYGWYTDQNLITPFDFASIVTKPITVYAKYALVGSVVTPDSTDNALGNDMVLEFSETAWAHAISKIKVGAITVDGTKYKVDTATHTITLDKSLFTKVGTVTINFSATDYADVIVTQKVVTGYNVQFVLPSNAPTVVKDAAKDQIVARRITAPTVYGYDLTWFADEARTIPWDFTSSIYSAKALYGKWSLTKFDVIFDTQDGGLVETKKADYNTNITAPTAPTRTGYTFVGWYKDPAGQTAWNFTTEKVTANTVLYAKWNINSYTVTFNSQGGSAVNAITANYNTLITAPAIPTKAGNTFDGWYKDAAGTIAWNFATDKVTSSVTLYAKWGINTPPTPVAPKAPTIHVIDDNDTTITGTADANVNIVVKNNGAVMVTGTANAQGNYSIEISPQKAGTVLTVVAIDAAGNQSEATSITVLDRTAPKAPKINTMDDNDTKISGSTEANAIITVKINGKTIATGKASAQGNYSIEISPQKAGTVLTVVAIDAAGNQSETTSITVLDRTAPKAPKINAIDDNDTKISGSSEAYATITVKINGKTIAIGKADSKGAFSIKMKQQKAGTVVTVTATDKSGNVSAASKIKVLDKTAPKAPKITSFVLVYKNQIQIKGTAEANSTIIVKNGSNVVASVKVSSKGTFTVKLSKLAKGKNTISLYAVDYAGNKGIQVIRSVTIK
jgi:uncharacterized repeat protein (TIGR02543 family)